MSGVTTVAEILQPMMGKPSILTSDGRCALCGRFPDWFVRVERHHIVRRSAGRMFFEGRELRKPEIMVCGLGNNLHDADGRMLCHGAIHHGYIHFRWHVTHQSASELVNCPIPFLGYWEVLRVEEPCDYQTALGMDGWKRLEVARPKEVCFGDGTPKEPEFMRRARAERDAERRGIK